MIKIRRTYVKVFNDFLDEYPSAKEFWNIVSRITTIKGSFDDLDASIIIQISNGYNAFMISWNAYKTTMDVTNLSIDDKNVISEINSFVVLVNSQIK